MRNAHAACPVPHCGGRIVGDEDITGRLLCNLAGHVVSDGEMGWGEKLLSNATPEHEQNSGPRETPDLEAVIARALTIPAAHPKESDEHE